MPDRRRHLAGNGPRPWRNADADPGQRQDLEDYVMTEAVLLQTVTQLSHRFGTPRYVLGGGGNTSAKTADTLWVKPSGTTLSGLTTDSFVAMDRSGIFTIFGAEVPAEPAAREAFVKDAMAAAMHEGQNKRASVEAPLHCLLEQTFVVHTHPALVNGLTCAQGAEAACARLFPDALWIPYIDPGYTLSAGVRRMVQEYHRHSGRRPSLLILQNHGVFVCGDTAQEVCATYERVMSVLEDAYRGGSIPTELPEPWRAPEDEVASITEALREALGEEAAGVAYGGQFAPASGPVTPDHIVYAKSYPFLGMPGGRLEGYRKRNGYLPRVFVTPAGVFTVGTTQKRADLALELARDGALVCQLAKEFGGIRFLSEAQRRFIENWEVESYRQKQVQ